jgi:hypothetical protein
MLMETYVYDERDQYYVKPIDEYANKTTRCAVA